MCDFSLGLNSWETGKDKNHNNKQAAWPLHVKTHTKKFTYLSRKEEDTVIFVLHLINKAIFPKQDVKTVSHATPSR